MQRIFRDSTTPHLIGTSAADGVLAYVNGDYRWPELQVMRFVAAHRQVVRIDVNGTAPKKASILDVERYDATPQTAKLWVPQRNAFRGDATIYCGRGNLDELFAVVTDPFWLIIADWTGSPHVVEMPLPSHAHIAGTQFASIPDSWDSTCINADGWHPKDHKDWVRL